DPDRTALAARGDAHRRPRAGGRNHRAAADTATVTSGELWFRCNAGAAGDRPHHRARLGGGRRGGVGSLGASTVIEDEKQLREQAAAAMQRLDALGLNRGSTGNLSVRWRDGCLITPSGREAR